MDDQTVVRDNSEDFRQMSDRLPEILPGFDLLNEVGRGGMGIVYRAQDKSLRREVAVKVLKVGYVSDSGAAVRFIEEARITGQLQHPGIPAVYQVGTLASGQPFLAMKLIKGDTLDALLKQNVRIDPLSIFEAIAQAVGFAHAHGVIHRDLKPANVMVGSFGEVQVMDWGLAKVLTPGRESSRNTVARSAEVSASTVIKSQHDSDGSETQVGSVMGTPAYMAPEQAAGEIDKVDARSDVFGLGAILCVILTGKPPFGGDSIESVRLAAMRGNTEEAFSRLDSSGADPGVVALCKNCLAFEPANRPASGNEVASAVAELRRAADDRARQAERDRLAAEVRAAEQSKRRRAVQWAAGVVVGVLALGVVGTGIGLYRAEQARRAAVKAERATEEKRKEAEAAREAEETQKKLAQAKEAEANAVVKFFQDHVFAAGRPREQDGGQGSTLSLHNAILSSLPALDTAFPDQPLVEARLRLTLGNTFSYLGEPKRASQQYELALKLFTRYRGQKHADTFASMNNLASSYFTLNRHAEALALREKVLKLQKEVLKHDDPNVLATMSSLANSYAAANRLDEALKLREDVLKAQKRVLPPGHPDTLATMNNLALSYFNMNRQDEALKLHEEILELRKRLLTPDHPDTLKTMNNLALSYFAQKRYAEALKLYEQVLTARKRVLPKDHPDTLKTMMGVAWSLLELNRGAEAIPVIDECVKHSVGKAVHPGLVPSMVDLRLRYYLNTTNPAGCRATAELWEELNRTDAASLYEAARLRSITATVQSAAGGADAKRLASEDANKAMNWLTKAVAAGYTQVATLKTNPSFAALHKRADFKKLVAEQK